VFERFLRWWFNHKELGWTEHGEIFTRYELFRCRWFKIYLHQLFAPDFLPTSHDHPWDFITILLKGGYWEQLECGKVHWRWPGSILKRSAETKHNIKTNGWSWSLVFSTPKRRGWSFGHCRDEKPLVEATHK
jgi:hypothetical protein